MNFSFLKPPKYGGNTKNMKFIVRKININENRLYYGDFDQKQIFQKKSKKFISDMWRRRCVSHIRNVFFTNTDIRTLSQKNFR